MCEITRSNFQEMYPQIKEALKNCSFLSIDCEFSSLCSDDNLQNSLFDTPSQRYNKTKKNIKLAIPVQIGITTFSFKRDDNIYTAKPFIFYIMPASFSFIDKSFICTSSSFNFLCDYKFDFNKFAYEGVPYINKHQEQQLLKSIKDGTLFANTKYSLQNKLRESIQEYSSIVSEWIHSRKGENEIILLETDKKQADFIYVLHKELRNRFCNKDFSIWTWIDNKKFKVKKITNQEYKLLCCKSNLDHEIVQYYLGFAQVFRLISFLKKPIIGHNFFLDLLILVNSFENELPNNYSSFKKLCCSVFPIIYDTKFLSFEIRNQLTEDTKFYSNGLEELYTYFRNEKGRHLAKNSPQIKIDDNFNKLDMNRFHDAGWDSYCTGYCFIRMAHYISAKKYQNPTRILMSSEHLKAVNKFKNLVNVIRATVSHVNLEGPDPVSRRPPCLIIKSTNNKAIDIYKVTEMLSQYGSIEIKPYSDRGRTVIAAIANFSSARRILGNFQNHKDFQISKYSIVKHSPVFRAALWTGALISGSTLAWLIHQKL